MEIRVKCKHCEYEWNYKGNKKVKCTCPDCMKRIDIKESTVKEQE